MRITFDTLNSSITRICCSMLMHRTAARLWGLGRNRIHIDSSSLLQSSTTSATKS
ncbi:hypothetical protein EG68_04929 [Paragonimus skrjabini miyazakii]|uniref:Uncharacterized protein n=1 Tax=Paragonimus skrjabini miyazakii TaxID=59628 RepID=A0A8S9YWD6_9TREM|nr:hypothetical protein EG68_04929 [Paragonimus skrjabini miyazakii]